MGEPQEIEAGFEDIQLKLNSVLDVYVGQVRESKDPEGKNVLCVVKSIERIHIKQGKVSMDATMVPIRVLTESSGG